MEIIKPKTKAMHVRQQDPVTVTTDAEAVAECKFVCPFHGCGFRFKSKHGMMVHKANFE